MPTPHPRAVFVHWLDPEYVASGAWTVDSLLVALRLKMLFGERVTASDMQLWDGFLLPLVFNDPEFRRLVEWHPELLCLAGRQPSNACARPDLEVALAGGARCLPEGAISSRAGSESGYLKDFARSVSDLGEKVLAPEFLEEFITHPSELTEDARFHIVGLQHGLKHFANPYLPNVFHSSATVRQYGEVLRELLEKETDPAAIQALEELHHFLVECERSGVPEVDCRRSVLHAELRRLEAAGSLDPGRRLGLWSTATHCYNRAIQASLGVALGSAASLGGNPIVGGASDEVVEILARDRSLRDSLARSGNETPVLLLGDMSWEGFRKLFDLTDRSRQALEEAREDGDTESRRSAFEEHTAKLGEAHVALFGKVSPRWDTAWELGQVLVDTLPEAPPQMKMLTTILIPLAKQMMNSWSLRQRRIREVAFKTFYRTTGSGSL
ncbi:MAG: hypothetical protein ACO1SV_04485 [Fimbriimonas sp.]